jgi:glutathione synthase/RimK-type ligase-like ATP-grasp enzyme
MKIYPYMNGSKSAKALAEGLGIRVLKREGKPVRGHLVINWGCSVKSVVREVGQKFLNHPGAVGNAANKLVTFELFRDAEVPTVEWTTNLEIALGWLKAGSDVVTRHKLSGHSGEGIEITTAEQFAKGEVGLVRAPLYTKYTKKKDEYRIHVFQGEVIFQQRKARKKDVPDDQVNWQVRNLAGGFIFANDAVVAPDVVLDAAKKAVVALGLDFGAVDVGYKDGAAVCYEVNTAMGLSGRNLESYVAKFKEFM